MKVSSFLLRALNVRRSEWGLVQKLFLLQFFQGAGIAFFFTAAFSRFLDHFPVKDLAYVYVLSSFLLWGAGFIYGKLEHHLSSSRLCNLVTLVLLLSMVLFRVGAATTNGNWFYFLMLAWFNVLYLLNNLMFWGMAAQLYDVRQSKRLFGVISAGDIPAKFIGYSVALFIVSYTGTANLLLAGFICILCSFPFLKKILQAQKAGKNHHSDSSKHVSGLNSIVKNYTDNKLIKRVAILSLIVSASVILINYGFYAEVKQAYKNDVEFARFIAFFLAAARLIALIIKILFTSRLLYWLGNRFALLVTPIIFISLIAVLLLTDMMNYNGKIVLYIFGLSAIMVDVLRSAINSPVLLTMMQPLATLQRLRAHNIVKGIMDPFAYFFCGAFLLIVFNRNIYSLEILVYVLLALALAWVIGIFRVHQQYLKTLIKTISSRYFSQEEFSLYDHAARELIENKINAGTELEVLYILKMLATRRGEESSELIIQALKHPSVRVINEAL
ncbi:MAG: Npt1/Npt2 family nucleotide transporter, partial [Chitinophagaceae bacterium]